VDKETKNILNLLGEIRALGQTGLHYTKEGYDRERYQRLLDLSIREYADLSGLAPKDLADLIQKNLGLITPKVAASAAIFSEKGKILLIRRGDDEKWSVPAGAGEVYENARQCAEREVMEEVGLEVQADEIIDVFCRLAGSYDQVHTMWTTMVHCRIAGGKLTTTDEAIEVGYFDPRQIPSGDWHKDAEGRVKKAMDFWHTRFGQGLNSI